MSIQLLRPGFVRIIRYEQSGATPVQASGASGAKPNQKGTSWHRIESILRKQLPTEKVYVVMTTRPPMADAFRNRTRTAILHRPNLPKTSTGIDRASDLPYHYNSTACVTDIDSTIVQLCYRANWLECTRYAEFDMFNVCYWCLVMECQFSGVLGPGGVALMPAQWYVAILATTW